jgi:uncharacterized damage-inducible protein DinB
LNDKELNSEAKIMMTDQISLFQVFEGWKGQQTSLVNAIQTLTAEQLRWRPADGLNSVGELARHISLGRIGWFTRMDAPGSAELTAMIDTWETDGDGNRYIVESALPIAESADELVRWLELSWGMIERTLNEWTVDDLFKTYNHKWNGRVYANSRQWTIYRILTHDVHHGAQIALMLGMHGVEVFELGNLFGHITLPPLAE